MSDGIEYTNKQARPLNLPKLIQQYHTIFWHRDGNYTITLKSKSLFTSTAYLILPLKT